MITTDYRYWSTHENKYIDAVTLCTPTVRIMSLVGFNTVHCNDIIQTYVNVLGYIYLGYLVPYTSTPYV